MQPRSEAPTCLWAPAAWLPGGWADDVLLRIGRDGRWSEVQPGVPVPPDAAERLDTPILPGLVNAHSHAFQRAMAGLAEWSCGEHDDFWSWRSRMYRIAERITPAQLRAIATALYVELLHGGYTQVCEFHYLHRERDGAPHADPYATHWALAEAAEAACLGLTLLPALYERGCFGQSTLGTGQQRFASSPAAIRAGAAEIARARRPLLNAGMAVHSLRAVTGESVHELQRLAQDFAGPIHIHVAEQLAEVEACVNATGARPVAWLVRERLLDPRWHLVHATHTDGMEIEAVARSGAGVVICPTTEANLGDGLTDLRAWLDGGVPLSIGSDSHVTRDWREELRWLDYGQRLALRRRNVCAPPGPQPGIGSSTANRLWQRVQQGSAAAAGEARWGLVAGARADALVPDGSDPALLGVPAAQALDAMVFSSPGRPWSRVMVAGRWVIHDGRHPRAERVAGEFADVMAVLHAPD